jgi:hypothetical protein
MLADAGVNSMKLPAPSPNLNAYAERFVRSIKETCSAFAGDATLWELLQSVEGFWRRLKLVSTC